MKAVPKIVVLFLLGLTAFFWLENFLGHHWWGYFWGVVVGILSILEFLVSWSQIPNRPPHVGLEVVRGKRRPNILLEGWYLLLPYFYTATLVNVEKKTLEKTFPDIRTRIKGEKDSDQQAGGEVSIDVSLTWAPVQDGASLIAYLNSGGEKGIVKIILAVLEEEMREMGAQYSWEQVSFNRDKIRDALIKRLTGEVITENQERQMANGLPVVMDLGIKIYRLNVGRVKEQGELAKAAELQAVEQQQKAGETIELDMLLEYASKMIEKDPTMTLKDAIYAVQIERGKVKDVQVVSGAEGLFAKFFKRSE